MTTNAPSQVLDAIRHEMSLRGISQRQLARLVGWDPIFTHRRISGAVAISVPELEQIAAGLGVPLAQLLPSSSATVTATTEPTPGATS